MTKKMLITDTFFISQQHQRQLEEAGYEVSRLEKIAATEDELIEALKDVSVYIIGGIEQVTERVLDSTSSLEAIIFTGVDYSKMIPASDKANQKGIRLLNAPGANAIGVAEFAVSVALAMQRQLFSISRLGETTSSTTRSLEGSNIGVIGAGNIGQVIINAVNVFNPHKVTYFNRSEKNVNAQKVELDELVATSDIIFLTLPMNAGQIFDAALIDQIKEDALVVSISPNNLFDYNALLARLQAGSLRAAIDWPSPTEKFDELSSDTWMSFHNHSAYNTRQAVKNVDDSVVKTAISLLNN